MRVLVVSPMYPSAENPAYGVFVRRQVDALIELGVDIQLATTSISRARRLVLVKAAQLAWQTLKGVWRGFDVVHVHFPTIAGLFGLVAARARRAPLVVTLHGAVVDQLSLADLSPWKAWLTRRLAVGAARGSAAVIAVGDDLASTIVREGVEETRVQVMDMGVDGRLFYPRPKSEVRRRLGLDLDGSLVVFAAWLISIKGPDYFIRAAALSERSAGCKWLLIGGGDGNGLAALASELGVSPVVALIGQRPADEMPLWFSAADVMVMPSLSEPFGLSALEAMACGTPVVASNVGGLRSFVLDGFNGYLVPPANAEAIASKVDLLLSDASTREALGANGVKTAAQHDMRMQARRVAATYEQVARRRER